MRRSKDTSFWHLHSPLMLLGDAKKMTEEIGVGS